MAFDGSEGAPIELDVAVAMTASYRSTGWNATKSVFLGKDILNKILNQGGGEDPTMGIRFYFALNDKGEMALVAVGASANQNDQLPAQGYTLADFGPPCPGSGCPTTTSPLEGVISETRKQDL
jgi:hypothetical protein